MVVKYNIYIYSWMNIKKIIIYIQFIFCNNIYLYMLFQFIFILLSNDFIFLVNDSNPAAHSAFDMVVRWSPRRAAHTVWLSKWSERTSRWEDSVKRRGRGCYVMGILRSGRNPDPSVLLGWQAIFSWCCHVPGMWAIHSAACACERANGRGEEEGACTNITHFSHNVK